MTQQKCIERRGPPKLPFYFIVVLKDQLIDLTSFNLQIKNNITKIILKLSYENFVLYGTYKNILCDTHLFCQRKQLPGESFKCFLNSLRSEAKKCEFGELEDRFETMQLIFCHQDQLGISCGLILK